jgi:hypothetical protein
MDCRVGKCSQWAEISAAIYDKKNITKSQNFTKVVMLLINIIIFLLHFITYLSITKLTIIIIVIIISISFYIILVYNIFFLPQK